MPLPDPNTWVNFDLGKAKVQKIFQQQLVTVIQALLHPAPLSTNTALGSVGANQTFNAAGAAIVCLSLTLTASITLTINNLSAGVPIEIAATTTGNFTLKLAVTQPNGVAYGTVEYASGGAVTNLITTGWVSGAAATRTFTGVSLPSGVLILAFV